MYFFMTVIRRGKKRSLQYSRLLDLHAYGRNAGIRTLDLTHPKGARYRAAPHPEVAYYHLAYMDYYTVEQHTLQDKE